MKPTQEQVIAWAREAGIKSSKSNGMFYTEYWDGVCPDGFVVAMALAYEAGRKDEANRIVNLMMIQHEAAKERHNYWHCAANLIQAEVASDT